MNEKIDFNEKNKIEELACDVLIKNPLKILRLYEKIGALQLASFINP